MTPPEIQGARRSIVTARGVRFHVTECGPADGRPLVALHGWPQHHFAYRDLLADPPGGMRVIAPDLPGYGWSGPAPHRWAKEDVASDVLALLDSLQLERVLLAGHDWGGWIGYLIALRAPERVSGLLALNMAHPWNGSRSVLPHVWRLAHMPLMAAAGVPIQRHTHFVERIIFPLGAGEPSAIGDQEIRCFADRFRAAATARAARDTYRTFLTREIPALAIHPEQRRATMPIRALHGSRDRALHPALVSPDSARADDYRLEVVPGAGHFLLDERPALVRERLLALADEIGAPGPPA
jgi:pimeloyl-ACP methyl ester carboxylesterase